MRGSCDNVPYCVNAQQIGGVSLKDTTSTTLTVSYLCVKSLQLMEISGSRSSALNVVQRLSDSNLSDGPFTNSGPFY